MANFLTYKIPAGDTPWYQGYWNYVDAVQAYCTEIEVARNGAASLKANIDSKVSSSGLTANLSAGGHRITDAADPQQPQDLTTKAYVASVVTAGVGPDEIPVTSLNKGGMTNGTYLRADPTTGVLYGYAPQITDWGVGTLTDGQLLQRLGAGLVGYTPMTYWQIQRLHGWRD